MTSKRKPASAPVETEAKIRVLSLVAVRRRIEAAGGHRLSVRSLETNTLFDSPQGALGATGRSFRVRRYGAGGSITLKGIPRVAGGLKSRVELESEVSAPETMAEILVSLGLVPQFRYEKFREVWQVGRTVICLDETPIGRFVEIEGTAAAIHRVAAALGFSADRFLSASYPGLWAESGRGGDMLFAKRARADAAPRPARKSNAASSVQRPRGSARR